MKKSKLDRLYKENILTENEYLSFFKTMHVNEKDEMIGAIPNGKASYKYYFDGDLLGGNLVNFLKTRVTPPLGAEYIDDIFGKYGMTVCGICDYWYWFTRDNITEYALNDGRRPIEEASELELWKMIAICERYWEIFYSQEIKK